MRVLHVVTRDQRRGAEVDAVHLAEGLRTAGHSGTVRALAPAPSGRPRLGVEPLGPAPLHARTLVALRRQAAAHDVVVAHGSTTLPATRCALVGTGTPFVYRTIGVPGAWATTAARRARVRWMLAGSAAVAALGEGSRRDVVALHHVPAERVVAVGCAQPESRFRPGSAGDRAAARRRLGVDDEARVAVALCALAPEKRLHDALDAAVLAGPPFVLLVAGDGPERAGLAQHAARAGADRVRLLGQVDDVLPLLHAADVAMLCSATEGVPGALVQAGLCGLPSVATDVGYVDEVVLDGRTGRLTQVGDVPALAAALLEATERAGDWGDAARRHCSTTFASAAVVSRWDALLRSL